MDKDHIEALTERQRACLRLLYTHYTIPEVAAELGLTVDGVKYHLTAARRALGASSSAQAARMVYGDHPPSDYSSGVASSKVVGSSADPDILARSPHPVTPPMVQEVRAPFLVTTEPAEGLAPSTVEQREGTTRRTMWAIAAKVMTCTNQIFGWAFVALCIAYAISRAVRWYELSHQIHPR